MVREHLSSSSLHPWIEDAVASIITLTRCSSYAHVAVVTKLQSWVSLYLRSECEAVARVRQAPVRRRSRPGLLH